MREQLDKLAELAREPGVVIQILPFTASDHPGTDAGAHGREAVLYEQHRTVGEQFADAGEQGS